MNEKQVMLFAADMIANSNSELARNISDSNRELGKKLECISKEEIRSRDRVDITLEEYERLKSQIDRLTIEVDRLRSILEKINVPLDKDIIPDSIQTFYCLDPISLTTSFKISFAINEYLKERRL